MKAISLHPSLRDIPSPIAELSEVYVPSRVPDPLRSAHSVDAIPSITKSPPSQDNLLSSSIPAFSSPPFISPALLSPSLFPSHNPSPLASVSPLSLVSLSPLVPSSPYTQSPISRTSSQSSPVVAMSLELPAATPSPSSIVSHIARLTPSQVTAPEQYTRKQPNVVHGEISGQSHIDYVSSPFDPHTLSSSFPQLSHPPTASLYMVSVLSQARNFSPSRSTPDSNSPASLSVACDPPRSRSPSPSHLPEVPEDPDPDPDPDTTQSTLDLFIANLPLSPG